jgi:hypothetical protein
MKDAPNKVNFHRDGTISYRHLGHWSRNVKLIPNKVFMEMPVEIRRKVIYLGCRVGYDLFVEPQHSECLPHTNCQ